IHSRRAGLQLLKAGQLSNRNRLDWQRCRNGLGWLKHGLPRNSREICRGSHIGLLLSKCRRRRCAVAWAYSLNASLLGHRSGLVVVVYDERVGLIRRGIVRLHVVVPILLEGTEWTRAGKPTSTPLGAASRGTMKGDRGRA